MSTDLIRKAKSVPSWTAPVAVLLALFLILGGVSTALAAVIEVDGDDSTCSDVTGTPYCTIQEAIDAASPGNTINVAAGTYDEILSITTDGIALIGADEATVIIDATGATSYHFTVDANGVTLKNFTLNGNNAAPGSYGLKISGLDTTTKHTGIVLENITVNHTYRSGIDVNGIDGLTITNVTVSGVPRGVGLALSDVDNADVNGVTTSGNAWGGTAIYTWGRYYPGGSDSVVLLNINGDEPNPLYFEVGNWANLASPYPITNFVLPPEYAYLVTNPDHRTDGVDGANFSFYFSSLADAIVFAEALNNATAPPNTSSSLAPLNPPAQALWSQDFESDAEGWFDDDDVAGYGQINQVASGTDGVASAGGGFHARVEGTTVGSASGPYSRFGGYRNQWPGEWLAELDIYLDTTWAEGSGFDLSVAATGTDGAHRRDFIFHVTKDTSTNTLRVGGSNNSNFAPREDLETLNNFVVPSSGWYTFQHRFYENGGVLAVDLNLLDSTGSILFTETRSDAADFIPSVVGGNRYAWFTHVTGIALAVDSHRLVCTNGQCAPNIYVEDKTVGVTGATSLSVPVMLNANEASLSSAAFAVVYDSTCLTLDTVTDSDNDGVPDSMRNLPGGHELTFVHDAGGARLDVLLKSPEVSPLALLNSGALVVLDFGLNPICVPTSPATNDVVFLLSDQSFGDSAGQSVGGTTQDGTYTLTANAVPTDITLAPAVVKEEQLAGTPVGTLTTVDPDASGSPTYELVDTCDGTVENYAFEIVGDQLVTRGRLNFEDKASYSVCVQTTDTLGASFAKALTVTVDDINEAPDSIALSSNIVDENASAPVDIGTLSATDPDAGTVFVFSLPAELDNSAFTIDGTTLKTAVGFDYESKSTYNVKVEVQDDGALPLSFQQIFTVVVVDVNDAPVANDDPSVLPLVVLSGSTTTIDVLANDTDDDGDVLSVSSADAESEKGGSVVNNITDVDYTAPAGYNGVDSFAYEATDATLADSATVTVQVVTDDARGDCNIDGVIDAADFPATVLEIFDTDLSIAWWNTFTGSFRGSPKGCDSNGSENGLSGTMPSVDAGDITCTVLIFFGDTNCTLGGLQTARAAEVNTVAVGIGELSGEETVAVPVELRGAGEDIAAATFALHYDPSAYRFDSADADGDGVADAVNFNAPAGMAKIVVHDEVAHRIQVAIFGVSLPFPVLSNGPMATIALEPVGDAAAATPLGLSDVSLGDVNGSSIPVVVDPDDASGGLGEADNAVFMPLINNR